MSAMTATISAVREALSSAAPDLSLALRLVLDGLEESGDYIAAAYVSRALDAFEEAHDPA